MNGAWFTVTSMSYNRTALMFISTIVSSAGIQM